MEQILNFWFETLVPADWFVKSADLDARIKEQFEADHHRITAGETSAWRDMPRGRLAEIIVLDQFSRNMFRGKPASFASDALALVLAQEAVRAGDDHALEPVERGFLYMPFMHSESIKVHEQALELYRDLPNFEYEIKHKRIIEKFGRYPHRNEILGRSSTAVEIEWMKVNPGF